MRPSVTGAKKGSKLKSKAGTYVRVFATRFDPDTTKEDVKQHPHNELSVDFSVPELKTKFPTYKSFKIEGVCESYGVIFNSEVWPENVLVRKFMMRNKSQSAENTKTT